MSYAKTQCGSPSFPGEFLFGAATSSHQVEGDNRWNDWWEYEQAGRLPHKSGRSCDHFNRYESDFELARSLGHNAHRLSVEWSRVEPVEGSWNEIAIRHYARVFEALQQRNLEPIVTLNHFTLPAWFLRRGGWVADDAPEMFADFVGRFVAEAGTRITYWLTINEPTIYIQQAYINGAWPPLNTRAWAAARKCLRNMARAHCLAFRAIKQVNSDARVAFAHSGLDIQPCRADRIRDRWAAAARDFVLNRLFFRMIGAETGQVGAGQPYLDFIGINYYTRCAVTSSLRGGSALVGKACKLDHHSDPGPQSSLGWEVYPQGLGHVIDRFSAYGLPMLISENGIATDDDSLRCQYIEKHLQLLAGKIADRRPIIGYLHWSLMDNYEWDHGFAPRFGLLEVDYETLERRPRRSAELFAGICRSRETLSG